ncbi:MAG: hypothetical protein FWD66_00820 [Paludibacter sp.]|nr:hypothetical protein [Paludibacter sp.]
MNNLIELFPAEHRETITRYKNNLSDIFDNYDVAIFMARKAICFYKALVLEKHLQKPTHCKIVSSRVLDYNVFDDFKGKKIIVIDDFVVRGESLTRTIQKLSDNNIEADVYILACSEDAFNLSKPDSQNIIDSYSILSNNDTFLLSQYITTFIEAAMCPYNIDQPIYSLEYSTLEEFDMLVKSLKLVDITSNVQGAHGIESYVFNVPKEILPCEDIKSKIELCKIRFLCKKTDNKVSIVIIPFVLLKTLTYEELDTFFAAHIQTNKIIQFINNKNECIVSENKLKVLHFVLAMKLMRLFSNVAKISGLTRLRGNDDFVFAANIEKFISESDGKSTLNFIDIKESSFDSFLQNEYISIAYDFLYSDNIDKTKYNDALGSKIKVPLLILSELKDFIASKITMNNIDTLLFSNIIDIFIDKGLIIPSIVHFEKTIVRGYKCGEVYHLGEEHFRLFAFVLSQYSSFINRDLYKTELEKLCVLFFRDAAQQHFIPYGEASGGQDEYSICFSKFGPRVSTSKPIYSASEDSVLASKLFGDRYIKKSSGRNTRILGDRSEPSYQIWNEGFLKPLNPAWHRRSTVFASKYSELQKAYEKVRKYSGYHLNSYIELLTMLSIGLNQRDQLLSLLAEIYLFKTVRAKDVNIRNILRDCNRILDGITSGMWKYMCYSSKTHPLEKLLNELLNNETTRMIGVSVGEIIDANPNADANPNIEKLINASGNLIFDIAYVVHFLCEKYSIKCAIDYRNFYKREFYELSMRPKRKDIEERLSASTQDDDLILLYDLHQRATQLLEDYEKNVQNGAPKNENNITIGIVTALPIEFAAMETMLHNPLLPKDIPSDDPNDYKIGTIETKTGKKVKVILACLKEMGTNNASSVTTHMLRTFTDIGEVILVGIAGGIPCPANSENHVRLGDIVCSNSILQYDNIKEEDNEIKIRSNTDKPSAAMIGKHNMLVADACLGKYTWEDYISKTISLHNTFKRPSEQTDILKINEIDIIHPTDDRRRNEVPRVFLGKIGSANILLKKESKRDYLRDNYGCRAIEMESAGVADGTWSCHKSYFVIRGIVDYCNPSKGDIWHPYAALCAAAYAKSLIELF